jgi:hypothetical protein
MKKALLALALGLPLASQAEAQVKNRWRLHWDNEKPQIHTYRSPADKYENYWYFTFTLSNKTDEIVPLIVDVHLYTESGKELQDDHLKVDPQSLKSERDNPRKAESLKYGRFYANVIDPEVEYRIIESHARLGNRSDGIVRESIEAFKKGFESEPPEHLAKKWKKGDRMYLNPREIRDARFIQPGQQVHGIAIFKNVDPRAHLYEIQVAGLVDILKVVAVTEEEWKIEYEPQTLKIRYERQGDPFEIERDVLYRLARKEYVVKRIGPVAAKDTVDKLVMSLADILKKEQAWKEKNVPVEELAKLRAKDGVDILDTRIMAMVFKEAVNKDFGYDGSKDVLENEKAVWRIHEWWLAHRAKLVFNEASNRYELKDDPLPGAVIDK